MNVYGNVEAEPYDIQFLHLLSVGYWLAAILDGLSSRCRNSLTQTGNLAGAGCPLLYSEEKGLALSRKVSSSPSIDAK